MSSSSLASKAVASLSHSIPAPNEEQRHFLEQATQEKDAQAVKRRKLEAADLRDVGRRFHREMLADSSKSAELYGLKTREEFLALSEAANSGTAIEESDAKKNKKEKKKKRKRKKIVVSCLEEEEDDFTMKSISKNPEVETDFLPDRKRDERLKKEKEQDEKKAIEKEERIKQETMKVVFSFWNGVAHRKVVHVKKGDTIGVFLEKARQELLQDFKHLRSVHPESLMFVKEDMIIPSFITFYDLITSNVQGRTGPLSNFNVHTEIGMADVRAPNKDSHAGKVCERSWYIRNKHYYPASVWEPFDPTKDRFSKNFSVVRAKSS